MTPQGYFQMQDELQAEHAIGGRDQPPGKADPFCLVAVEQFVGRMAGQYETLPTGLRALTALLVLRNKAIKPLLAAAQPLRPTRGAHNPHPIDAHYQTINLAMQGVFHELGLTA
jgi:hypothetical protein